MLNVAINGLGRIGRATLKIVLDKPTLRLAAVNDVLAADNLAYLLKFDTVYGRWTRDVSAQENGLNIDGTNYPVLKERDPAKLPWRQTGVDVVFECTGALEIAATWRSPLKLERALSSCRLLRKARTFPQ